MRIARLQIFVFILSVFIASCGMAISNAERLELARSNIDDGEYREAVIQLRNILVDDADHVEARIALADALLHLNDLLTAEKELQRAAELGAGPQDIERVNLRLLAAKGDYAALLAALAEMESSLPQDEFYDLKGEALLGMRSVAAAEEHFGEWLQALPESSRAKIGLAKARALQGSPSDAIRYLEEVLAKNNEESAAWLALGNVHYGLRSYSKAADAFRNAVSTGQPQFQLNSHIFALVGLSDCELVLGDVRGARDTVAKLAVYAPNLPETLLQRARVFQLEGDFQSAGRELTKLFNREPDDLRIMFALAANQWRAGNIYQAQDYLTRIVTLSPENTRAKRLLAQVQLQQKNTNLAVEILEPMLAQNSGDAELLGLLAIADMQRGQTGLALDHLRTATELDPENTGAAIQLAEGYVIAGNPENAVEILVGLPVSSLAPFSREKVLLSAYRDLGRLDEARALVAGLVDDHGNNFEALQLAARFYVNIKEYGEGREILQQLIQISPRSSQAKLMLAKLDLTQSRQASASKHFQDVFEDDSTNLTAILGLVQIALENGETGQALGLLERAVSLHPLEPVPALVLADLYLRGGRAQDAVMIAESLADLKFDDVGVVRSVGRVFFEAGHLQQAQEQFAIAVAREPGSVALMLDLTRALMSSGNYAEALDVSQQAIDVDPTSMPARILQVLTMIRLGQLDAAHERAIALVKDRPDDPAAALARAEVLAAREDYSNAVQAFRDAAEKGAGLNAVLRETQVRMAWGADEVPEFPLVDWIDGHGGDYEAKKSLAEIYQQQGKRDAARGTYIELLVDAPDDPVVLNNLAVELQLVGDLARALRHAQRANKLNPHSGAIADTLGWIYRDMGDHQNSIKFLREANRLLPGNKDVLYHLAAALADAGVTGEAREILINILQAPGSFASLAEAEKLLASL